MWYFSWSLGVARWLVRSRPVLNFIISEGEGPIYYIYLLFLFSPSFKVSQRRCYTSSGLWDSPNGCLSPERFRPHDDMLRKGGPIYYIYLFILVLFLLASITNLRWLFWRVWDWGWVRSRPVLTSSWCWKEKRSDLLYILDLFWFSPTLRVLLVYNDTCGWAMGVVKCLVRSRLVLTSWWCAKKGEVRFIIYIYLFWLSPALKVSLNWYDSFGRVWKD